MAEPDPEQPFFTERRSVGLLGAAVLATIAYELGTAVSLTPGGVVVTGLSVGLSTLLFFVIFVVVFTVLNYAVWRWD